MKRIILFLVILICSLASFSQTTKPQPPYTQLSTGVFRIGYSVVDSGLVFPRRDTTAFRPTFPGTGVYRVVSGDSALWLFNGVRYDRVVMQKALNDTASAIRNNIYWQLDGSGNLTNKTFPGNNIEPFKFMKIVQPGFTGSQFDGWPGNYATAFNKNILGIYGDEPSLDILIDSSSQFNIGGITFRSADGIVPRLPANRFGASAAAKIEYNAFVNGGDTTSTMEFFLGDQDNTTIHLFAFSGPGVHFYGNRKVATLESKEALWFGTAIRGVNSAALSGLADTSYFAGDAGNKNMYIFNMNSVSPDTTNYKPMVYNPSTGVMTRSSWPNASTAINNTNLGSGYRALDVVSQGIKTFIAGTNMAIDTTTTPGSIIFNATPGGAGGVISVATDNATGITGGTITTTGTLSIDTVLIATRAWRQKGTDSLLPLINLKLYISDTSFMLLPYLRKIDTTAMLAPYLRKQLGSGQIFVGNGSNVATAVSASGDIASISSAGAFTLSSIIIGGSCTNCDITYDSKGRIIAASNGSGGGGGSDSTFTKPPIYVISGTKDTIALRIDAAGGLDTNPSDTSLRIASSGANTQVMFWTGTRTFAGDAEMTYNSTTNILTTSDYKYNSNANFSSLNRDSKLYAGVETNRWRDSTRESRFIIRFPFDGAGVITPTFIQDSDHELIGYDSLKAVGFDVVTYRPTVNDVHSMWVQQDETLARLVGGFGASVGLSATTIRGYRHSTWGGAIYWNSSTRVFYSDGAVINDNTPGSITYDSTTGILTMTMTTWMTTGSERDYKKLSATMSQSGLNVEFRVQSSSNTLLTFKITDASGSVVPPYMFDNNTAMTFIMPTWHTQLPLGDIGGGHAWLQNFITSSSNIWGGQTDKRN